MKSLVVISLAASLMVTACSQPATNARSYQYGGTSTAGSSLGLHTMRKGETLWTVAKSYHVDLRDMLDINGLNAPYKTKLGERIKIPAPAYYKVRQGDTLYKVSRMFDTTTTELTRLNQLKAPYALTAHQNLRLPPRHPQSVSRFQTSQQTTTISYIPVVKTAANTSAAIEREELQPVISAPAAPLSRGNQEEESGRPSPAVLTGNVNFMKPVAGKVISGYGPKADGLHNDGVNIKAAAGDAVRAAEQGIVAYQGNQIEGYGNMVLIRHANGYLTAYAHMAKTLVKKGDKVKRGQAIGTVGASGNVKSPQLHFEIRKGRDAIDPKTLLQI